MTMTVKASKNIVGKGENVDTYNVFYPSQEEFLFPTNINPFPNDKF